MDQLFSFRSCRDYGALKALSSNYVVIIWICHLWYQLPHYLYVAVGNFHKLNTYPIHKCMMNLKIIFKLALILSHIQTSVYTGRLNGCQPAIQIQQLWDWQRLVQSLLNSMAGELVSVPCLSDVATLCICNLTSTTLLASPLRRLSHSSHFTGISNSGRVQTLRILTSLKE